MSQPIPLETDFPELGTTASPAGAAWASGVPEPAWAAGSLDAAAELAPAEDPGLPSERVRFSAPLVVEVPGIDERVDGVIVNLSEAGLACVLPVALHVDERLTCRFRPALGEEHVALAGEVVWRRRAGGQDSLYGVRFAELSAADRERLRVVLRERIEGRAGEWPLPVVPSVAAGRRRASPYVAAAVGMAAGALLSLGISLVPTYLSGRGGMHERRVGPATEAQPVPVVAESSPVAEGQPQGAENAIAATPRAADPAAAAALPSTSTTVTSPTPGTKSAAASQAPGASPAPARAAPASSPATPPKPATSSSASSSIPAPAPVKSSVPAAGSAAARASSAHHASTDRKPSAVATARGLELTLPLDRPGASLKTFWLDGPRRLVIDVHGARGALDATEYPLPGTLASRLRVGLHDDRVRFVIDAAATASSDVKAVIAGQSVVVRLEAR